MRWGRLGWIGVEWRGGYGWGIAVNIGKEVVVRLKGWKSDTEVSISVKSLPTYITSPSLS